VIVLWPVVPLVRLLPLPEVFGLTEATSNAGGVCPNAGREAKIINLARAVGIWQTPFQTTMMV